MTMRIKRDNTKFQSVVPITFTKVTPNPEKSCIHNPRCRLLGDIEKEIAEVEARISEGIDAGPAWNHTINKYNELCQEYSRALKKKNEKQ